MNPEKDFSVEPHYGKTPTADQKYALRLYVTGTTSHSVRALANIKAVCDKHLQGRYELEVIDIYQYPLRAQEDQIIAAPTLIRKSPLPPRTLVGDMSDTAHVLQGLDIS